MLRVDLKKLYFTEDFEKEGLDIVKIKKEAVKRIGAYRNNYLQINNFSINDIHKRAIELTNCHDISNKSFVFKELFVNNFVFSDDEKFISNLKKINIDIADLKRFILKLYNYKDKADVIGINYKPIVDIKKFYNISNNEIIINKLYELIYFHEEFFYSKVKTKRTF